MTTFNKRYSQDLIALISGIILPLAFAPFKLYPIAIFSPAILLFIWLKNSPQDAFRRGWVFGLGFFGVGVSWVYVSIHTYGNANIFLSVFITALLIMYLAFFPALQGYLFSRFPHNYHITFRCLLFFPTTWVLCELLRAWSLTGFPWLSLGYSQMNSPLRSLAPIVSVYGVSFATAFLSGALILILKSTKLISRINILILVVSLWATSIMLIPVHWTTPDRDPISVSLIQGNIPQRLKWDSNELSNIMQRYQKLTEAHWNSDIIVWPEAAIPAFSEQIMPYLNQINKKAKKNNTAIIMGVPIMNKATEKFYNATIVLGTGHGVYLKRHLVPFGEFLPFSRLLKPLLNYLHIPMSDFSEGPLRQSALIANNLYVAPFICYEIIYPTEVLNFLPQAQLLVTITDDSWFGKSIASAQHLQMAQMRSLETGRYQLLSTNDGITAIINPDGSIQKQAPTRQKTVLTGKINAMQGKTPWIIWWTFLFAS